MLAKGSDLLGERAIKRLTQRDVGAMIDRERQKWYNHLRPARRVPSGYASVTASCTPICERGYLISLEVGVGRGNNMTKGELRTAISRGYREMSELTKVKCGGDKCPGVGNRAYRCCDRMHCQMTIDHAYKDWGIRLPTTGHQLPLMGPTGCTALPHLRPWCTLHQCQIQETGCTKDRTWDAKYFRLRNKLIRLEQQLAAM